MRAVGVAVPLADAVAAREAVADVVLVTDEEEVTEDPGVIDVVTAEVTVDVLLNVLVCDDDAVCDGPDGVEEVLAVTGGVRVAEEVVVEELLPLGVPVGVRDIVVVAVLVADGVTGGVTLAVAVNVNGDAGHPML